MTRDEQADYERGLATLRRRLSGGLSEASLQSVQRKLRAPARDLSASWRYWLAGALSAAAVATLLVFVFRPHPETPKPAEVAQIRMWGVSHGAVRSSPRLAIGERLALSAGDRVDVAIADTARVSIIGPGTFAVAQDGRLAFESVSASVSVAKQAPGHEVSFILGDAEVVVHGTLFDVAASAGRAVGVRVSEGVVEVKPASGMSAMLHAGEQWGEPPAARGEDPFAAAWWRGGQAPMVVTTQPIPLTAPARPPPRVEAPAKPAPSKQTDTRALVEKAAADRDCAQAHVLLGRFTSEGGARADAAKLAMLEADCWLRTQQKDQALAVLDTVATDFASEPVAQSALFEAATTRADLKRSAEAIAGFDAYLQRYPRGSFAEAAGFRRCELIAQPNHRNGGACLEAFARDYPSGRRAGEALLLAGSLACADERIADASRVYFSYLDHVDAQRDDVDNLARLLRCLEHGTSPDATRAREAFEKRHP